MNFKTIKNNKKFVATFVAGIIIILVLGGSAFAANKPQISKKTLEKTMAKVESTPTPSVTTPTPTTAAVKSTSLVTPTKTASTVQSTSGNNNNSNNTPQPTHTPTPTPTITPTATPTPQSGTTIKGRYIDKDGNSISLSDMKVKISHSTNGYSQESNGTPNFEFSGLVPGGYYIEAQSKDGYAISHDVCFNCENGDHFYDSKSFVVNVTESHKTIGVTFKYSAQ